MGTRHEFVHCHVHSQYSLLDGASRIKDLVARAADTGMGALAVTDHGVMYGAIEFYKEAKEKGIKPLIGMEAYVANGDRRIRAVQGPGKPYGHLVLIAKNQQGYENLVKLNTIGHLEGYYHKPRIDAEVLEHYHEGLIALSACIGGQVPSLVLQGRHQEALDKALWYKGVFGDDFYLEVQDHGLAEQRAVNRAFLELSEKTGIRLAATNDSHYTHPGDTRAHDALICIGTGRNLNDAHRKMAYGPDFYVKSPSEMAEVFHDLPQALRSTLEIAEKVDLKLDMGRNRLPVFEVPDGKTAESHLIDLAWQGLRERYDRITPELEYRLKFELDTVTKMGFPAYFLIVWDFIAWAKRNGIPVGPGRGSAAGSLVAYCLGITELDPVKYNLLFERFLNPERVSMPDIDVDFCIDRRGEVIRYVREKYGDERVAQIVTFNTLKAKAAIKDVGRVMGLSFAETNDLCKKVGDDLGVTLDDASKEGTELAAVMERDERVEELVGLAKRLEGLSRNTSVHAAGVIIAEDPLEQLVPLTRLDRDKGDDGGLVTQYEQKYLEMLGLLKMDFLGLRNLTMIGRALDLVKRNHPDRVPDFSNQDFTDPAVYELLRRGDTIGVFQVESEGMTKLVRQLQPTNFEDISAILALYRPGPLQSGYVDEYVDRKHGRKAIDYPHPALEPILRDTYGTMVYQEQIMQIAQVLGNYSLGGADMLRRAMGKKKADEMAKQRATFLEGCIANQVDETVANDIFDKMTKFSEYCFNRAHTAAYAVLTYQTAYLKAHFPREYMAALLSSYAGNTDKIMITVHNCRQMGIPVLPPDISTSEADFTVVPEGIRFGLASVKNVGLPAVEEIQRVRQTRSNGRFTDLFDFLEDVDLKTVNRRCLESLIQAGACDGLGQNRAHMLAHLETVMNWAQAQGREAHANQVSLFGDMTAVTALPRPNLEQVPPGDPQEALKAEKDLVGLYLSAHPLDHLPCRLEWHVTATVADLARMPAERAVVLGGILQGCRRIITKKGDAMLAGKLEDFTGTMDFVVFPKTYARLESLLQEDARLLLKGKFSGSEDERPQVEVEDASELAGLRSLHVTLPSGTAGNQMVVLKELLKKHKGNDPVILHIVGTDRQIVTGEGFWVQRQPELDQALNRLTEGTGPVIRHRWVEPAPLLA
ncbi:MAG: DNA polymerase III subunit alpha [Candidatus Sericytochromatia bacterium]|nr:DNA polymerase III subunit alpha [Candidatus Sericytochromatia bacterium]